MASMVCLYAMLGLGVMTWNSRVGGLAGSFVPQPWLTMVVVLVLALVMFPVWFPRGRTLVRKIRERRRRVRIRTGPRTTSTTWRSSARRSGGPAGRLNTVLASAPAVMRGSP